jgi:two-component system chemotaxis sensor kinase CheA
MSEYQGSFRAEAQELLNDLENGLLELEESPTDRDLVEPVFRSLHTIKGNCKFLGFHDVAEFAHEIEAAFEFVRKGQMTYNREFGKLALTSKDLLRTMVESHYGEEPVDNAKVEEVLRVLKIMEEEQTTLRKDEAKKNIDSSSKLICTHLQTLAETPTDQPLLKLLYDAFILLRDAASVLGTDLALFVEKFGNAYLSLSEKNVAAPPTLIQLTTESVAFFPTMVQSNDIDITSPDMDPMILIDAMQKPILLLEQLNTLAREHGISLDSPKKKETTKKAGKAKPAREVTYRIVFTPSDFFKQTGIHLADLEKEIGAMGKLTTVLRRDLEEATPDSPATMELLVTTAQKAQALKEVFQFAENTGELSINLVDQGAGADPAKPEKKVGEILVDRGDLSADELAAALAKQKDLDAEGAGAVDLSKLKGSDGKAPKKEKGKEADSFSFMRVSLRRLTELVNLIGELVAQKSRLLQRAQILENNELISVAEELGRLIEKLRDGTMINRMKPIGETFQKFDRMAIDLARELGKEVVLTMTGTETELDMATLEKLNDPLVHLIRNTVDHGIETPEIREAARKPRFGTVNLTAEHSGSMVVIKVHDDGAGLNDERIIAKAIERGLVKPDAKLTKHDIFQLIFLPGFSTAAVVTNISGRGTGMDVVKRSIDALHGTIDITSTKGQGSTFTLKLPLTLAIMEGLLVRVGQRRYIFPLAIVEEIVNLDNTEHATGEDRNIKNVRGSVVPFIRLRERFQEEQRLAGPIEQMVICQVDDKRTGFVVDEVIGEHHTLVKNLGSFYKDATLFSGITILGDGSLALILDMIQVVHAEAQVEQELLARAELIATATTDVLGLAGPADMTPAPN